MGKGISFLWSITSCLVCCITLLIIKHSSWLLATSVHYINLSYSSAEYNDLFVIPTQLMEYCHLLDLADECEDPYMRMVYTCKYFHFLLVILMYLGNLYLRVFVIMIHSFMGNICLLCIPKNMEAIQSYPWGNLRNG